MSPMVAKVLTQDADVNWVNQSTDPGHVGPVHTRVCVHVQDSWSYTGCEILHVNNHMCTQTYMYMCVYLHSVLMPVSMYAHICEWVRVHSGMYNAYTSFACPSQVYLSKLAATFSKPLEVLFKKTAKVNVGSLVSGFLFLVPWRWGWGIHKVTA